MKAKHKALLRKTRSQRDFVMYKLLIECWNAETPHFGGAGPHRYDGTSTKCAYCERPKDWKAVNAGFAAEELSNEEEK